LKGESDCVGQVAAKMPTKGSFGFASVGELKKKNIIYKKKVNARERKLLKEGSIFLVTSTVETAFLKVFRFFFIFSFLFTYYPYFSRLTIDVDVDGGDFSVPR